MKIYIASSWRNQHVVELLTMLFRQRGYIVLCFVENTFGGLGGSPDKPFPFDVWINSESAEACFNYDVKAVSEVDLVVYIGPSGIDAWTEIGIAYGSGTPIVGLWAKGESVGIVRKVVRHWVFDYKELLDYVDSFDKGRHEK